MTFKEYLTSKKIDPKDFALTERDRFRELKFQFDQMSPASFSQQKLYLINPLRRKYKLREEKAIEKPKVATKMKPKMKPRS